MSTFGGRTTLLYLLLGPCLGSILLLMDAFVLRDERGIWLANPFESFFFGLVIGLVPFLMITFLIAIFDAFLKRVPVYVPLVCSIIPFLIVWGFDFRMLGDVPKNYFADLLPALMLTILPAMIVWSIIWAAWGSAKK